MSSVSVWPKVSIVVVNYNGLSSLGSFLGMNTTPKNINSKTLLFAIMSKSISIDVPEEIWILISKDELLKKAMERIAVEEFRKLLLKYFVAEEITGVVNEKEIVRIDDELKEKAWEGLKQKWKL